MRARWLVKGLKIAVFATVAVAVLGFVLMSLWNWLGPAVFGARTITFWQALGILVLQDSFRRISWPAALWRTRQTTDERPMGADDSRGARKIPDGNRQPLQACNTGGG